LTLLCGNCEFDLIPTIEQALEILDRCDIGVEQINDSFRVFDRDEDWDNDYFYSEQELIDYSLERDETLVHDVITGFYGWKDWNDYLGVIKN